MCDERRSRSGPVRTVPDVLRHRADIECYPDLAAGDGDQMALHCSRQANAEWLHRELSTAGAVRRMPNADDVLQHLFVQAQIGGVSHCVRHKPPQLRVLVLKLLEPPHLCRQQPIVPFLPIEIGRLADPGLAAHVRTGSPSVPCFRMNAFWASENFEALIALRSSQPGRHHRKRGYLRGSRSSRSAVDLPLPGDIFYISN